MVGSAQLLTGLDSFQWHFARLLTQHDSRRTLVGQNSSNLTFYPPCWHLQPVCTRSAWSFEPGLRSPPGCPASLCVTWAGLGSRPDKERQQLRTTAVLNTARVGWREEAQQAMTSAGFTADDF